MKLIAVFLLCCPPVLTASAASICPDNFEAFADTTTSLACACSAEAAQAGQVWGMDVYTSDSSVCRASAAFVEEIVDQTRRRRIDAGRLLQIRQARPGHSFRGAERLQQRALA